MSTIKVDTIATRTGSGSVTVSNNASLSGTLGVTGETTLASHLNMGDNDKIKLGASSDLEIYHDASDSVIAEVGTGNLSIRADDFYVMKQDGSEVMIRADTDSFVRLYFDNSEKLATQSQGVNITGNCYVQDSGYASVGIGSTGANGAAIFLDGDSNGDFSGGHYSYIRHDTAGRLDIVQDSPSGTNQIRLFTDGATERMRVSSNVLIGTTNNSPGEGTTVGVRLGTNGASQFSAGNQCLDLNRSANNGDVVVFRRSGIVCGEIVVNGDNQTTAYQTSSDYRLKENVTYDFDATTRLKQLKPARFNFISDPNNTTVDGFLAHEVSSIVPEAIGGEKDGTQKLDNVVLNSDGTVNSSEISEENWIAGKEDKIYASDTTWVESKSVPDHQAIDQSKLVPLLTKALQEAISEIETLKTKVTALEGG